MNSHDDRYWRALDALVAGSRLVIDRPRGSRHPCYPDTVYPLDYGYLDGTHAADGQGIDCWVGSLPDRTVTGVVYTVDMHKRDMEAKLLLGCTPAEMQTVLAFLNDGAMSATLVERAAVTIQPQGDSVKTLLLIHGPNGVGKSTACAALHRRLPRSARLDSDWCRMIQPFAFTPETEALVVANLTALLRGYLGCSQVDHVIFSYGFHGPRQRIWNQVLGNLSDLPFRLVPITLTCSEAENIRRMQADGRDADRMAGALQTRALYEGLTHPCIDTTGLSVEDTVERILAVLQEDRQVV